MAGISQSGGERRVLDLLAVITPWNHIKYVPRPSDFIVVYKLRKPILESKYNRDEV
jgi:riboflavin transporter FmnP